MRTSILLVACWSRYYWMGFYRVELKWSLGSHHWILPGQINAILQMVILSPPTKINDMCLLPLNRAFGDASFAGYFTRINKSMTGLCPCGECSNWAEFIWPSEFGMKPSVLSSLHCALCSQLRHRFRQRSDSMLISMKARRLNKVRGSSCIEMTM